jgi:hypothetical protein
MDEEIVKQILDELFSYFEDSETQSAALLLFLRDQGIATQEKLAPYFEQAANTSEVRWRAARVRMGALLASALKTSEPAPEKETKTTAAQAKTVESTADADTKEAEGQTPEPKPEGPKNEAGDGTPREDVKNKEDAAKNKAVQNKEDAVENKSQDQKR